MEVDSEAGPDLGRTLDTVRRRKAWVIGAVVFTVMASLVLSLLATKQYATSAQVDVPSAIQTSVFTRQALRIANPEQIAGSQIAVVESPKVAQKVEERIGARFSEVRSVSVESVGEDTRLDIRVTAPTPSLARDAANAYAEVYEAEQRDLLSRGFQRGADSLERYTEQLRQQSADLAVRVQQLDSQIASLQGAPAFEVQERQLAGLLNDRAIAASEQQALSGNIQTSYENISQLRVEADLQRQSATNIVSPAELRSRPVSPVPERNVAVAAAVGLVLGLGLAFGREALETAISDPEHVKRLLPDVPVLGTTLDEGRRRRSRFNLPTIFGRMAAGRSSSLPVVLGEPTSPRAEAYRSLRTSFSLGAPEGVVLVTSPAPLDSKDTTVANLAASLAIGGRRVILVSADLRRPRLHEDFGMSNDVGVTSVLLEGFGPREALQPVASTDGLLMVLPSGPVPTNPAELLASDAMGQLLRDLKDMADYVLLDSPPCLPVTDALVTAHWADAVVLVAGQGSTREHEVLRATDLLRRQSEAPLIGVIVSDVPARRRSSYLTYYERSSTSNGHGGSVGLGVERRSSGNGGPVGRRSART